MLAGPLSSRRAMQTDRLMLEGLILACLYIMRNVQKGTRRAQGNVAQDNPAWQLPRRKTDMHEL